jgi:EmrB/QacA subfamily drug resistance transporter
MTESLPPHARAALLAATVASFVTPFMGSSVVVALPALGRAFSLDAVGLGWFVTVYLLAAAVALVPIGRLADLHGRERVFSLGLVVFSVSSLACGLSPGVAWLLAWRGVQGLGAAMVFGTSVALVSAAYPPGRRGRAIGITISAVYVGLSIGPLAGGLLTAHAGWRSIFYVGAALGVAAAVVAFAQLRGWRGFPTAAVKSDAAAQPGRGLHPTSRRFDAVGALLYALGLAALMYGLTRLPSQPGLAFTAAGAIVLATFIRWERRSAWPVVNVELFLQNRVFAMANLAALINYSATAAVTLFLSIYLQQVLGRTPQFAGFVLVAQPVVQALVAPWAGRLSDRVESRIVASAGMATIVVGLACAAALPAHAPLWWIVASLALLGAGFGLFASPNTNAVMSAVKPHLYGVAAATVSTMRLTGQAVSTGIATMLLAIHLGGQRLADAPAPALMAAHRSAFVFFAVICALGALASLARGTDRASRH